jgi:sugar phosphate isomerase/epimerase
MDTHWNSYCGLSLVHFLAFPECGSGQGPILESVERIVLDDFFSGIEISRINDPATRKQVAKLIEQTHCKVDFGVHPIILGDKLNINSLDENQRKKACEILESYLDQAVELGAKRFMLLSGPDPGPAERSEAFKVLVESLQHLCERAQERQLSVVLETFDRDVDKKALIGPADEAAMLAAELRKDFEDFGLLYDMGHMVLLNEQPFSGLSTLKNYLAHIHVGNCVKVPGRASYGDFHPRFGFPGSENDVPELAAFIQALFEVGYLREDSLNQRPAIGFEVKPQAGESSAVVLANIKRAWRDAWSSLETMNPAASISY